MYPFLAAISIPFPVVGTASLFVLSGAILAADDAVSLDALIAQSPFVGGMLLMLWWFLKHVERKDDRTSKVIDRNTEAIRDLTIAVKTKNQ